MFSDQGLRRGFVTIATGSKHYYELAFNLLRSYRRNGGGAYPFAIIAEEENEYTTFFDKVVLMPAPAHSYMDKLRLYECLPYDEVIFIDADCLVYGAIDEWWRYFEKAPDFCCFGRAYDDLSTDKGWFRYEGMGKYREQIRFVPSFSGGVYFLRKTPAAARVIRIAMEAAAHYRDYPFAIFHSPADEPVLALGMAVCDCRPVDVSEVGIYVDRKNLPMDILEPSATWRYGGEAYPVKLVHWGSFGTMKAQYLLEVQRLDRDLAGKPLSPLAARLLYCLLLRHDFATLLKRVRLRVRLFVKTGHSKP